MMYLPFIIFANLKAVVEISSSVRSLPNGDRRHRLRYICVGLALIVALNTMVKINDTANGLALAEDLDRTNPIMINWHRTSSGAAQLNREIVQTILQESHATHLSVANNALPLLSGAPFEKLDAFPVSLYEADLIMVRRVATLVDGNNMYLTMVPSYIPESTLRKRLWIQGYLDANFEIIKEFPDVGNTQMLTIYSRIRER